MAVSSELESRLSAALKGGKLLTDPAARQLYAQNVYTRAASAAMVARASSLAELQSCMALLHAAKVPCVAHGGGLSYTGGLVPDSEGWAVIGLGLMDRVIEINRRDMTVTVECGCSWKKLHEALAGTGLRTPYWGTLSGIRATVGGGLSQNAVFWGSGQHGSAVDSLLSLTVVLADGTRIDTSPSTSPRPRPHWAP